MDWLDDAYDTPSSPPRSGNRGPGEFFQFRHNFRFQLDGESLTQRVRDLRDQVTNAPQNLLALESRFMSGDMPEPEYKATREDYRNQLTRNLRSIDEIRSLLLIMSQLDARPATPGSAGPVGMTRPISAEQ